jgi:hypothetical protein
MPSNYVLLGKVTLTADTASVTFSSLPTTGYTDLKLVYSTRVSAGANPAHTDYIKFNNSSTNFKYRNLQAAGSGTPGTNTDTNGIVSLNNGPAATASTFSNTELYISNYRSSAYKSFTVDSVTENNATTAYIQPLAGLWSNVSPITEINIDPDSGNYVAGTEFCLYGISAVGTNPTIAPFATGGDSVTNDGTYWIHTFLSSGTFVPAKTLACDYLVVAGGGGGGAQVGGGGGAGGYRTSIGGSTLPITANQRYEVLVGAGGIQGFGGAADTNTKGRNGTNSVFASISATGGGAGGSYQANSNGNNGGSGGGGTYGHVNGGTGAAGVGNAGSYSPAEGKDGGLISGSNAGAAGGGGGATSNGGNSSSGVGGTGGAGTANSISGSSVTYAGGGGGANAAETTSAGGAGGGGNGGGGSSTSSTPGTANTGGGGGGNRDSNSGTGSAGGSGIVIIRYPMA